jgi:hypothetical protein
LDSLVASYLFNGDANDSSGFDKHPQSFVDALTISILDDLTIEERFCIADLKPHELRTLQLVMGKYMKFRIEQPNEQGNRELLKECRERSGDDSMDDSDAAAFVLKEIWSHIRETNKIRVVK